ncbi:MAG: hypothetical protein NTY35_05970 [Planctomycetota bacterium]|nr:hypothetical protein [Planctomycetota bacterium]
MSAVLDEEAKALLRRIVERTAYRQIMVANIRGHGLKYLLDVTEKTALVRDLEAGLDILRHVERLYGELDGDGLAMSVRDAMDRIPYPYSRLELAVCLSLVGRTERLVASTYLESRSAGMVAIAQRIHDLERPGTRMLEMQLADFCAETGNRATAQQFVNRWLAIALVGFGRPGTVGDQRSFALGLRSARVEQLVKLFLTEARPWCESFHLVLPDVASLGIDLAPDGAKHGVRAS